MSTELDQNVEIVPNNLPYKENSRCCVGGCPILATLMAVYNGEKIPCCRDPQHQKAAKQLALNEATSKS